MSPVSVSSSFPVEKIWSYTRPKYELLFSLPLFLKVVIKLFSLFCDETEDIDDDEDEEVEKEEGVGKDDDGGDDGDDDDDDDDGVLTKYMSGKSRNVS